MVKHDVDRTIKETKRKHTITAIHTHTQTHMQADSHTGKNKIFNLDKQQVRGRVDAWLNWLADLSIPLSLPIPSHTICFLSLSRTQLAYAPLNLP